MSAKEAKAYLAMSEREQRKWRKKNPLVKEAVEVMAQLSDGSVKGHLGYFFDTKDHKAEELLQRTSDEIVAPLRSTCRSCLQWAWDNNLEWSEATKRCGLECTQCVEAAVEGSSSCKDHGVHHTHMQCESCKAAGFKCERFYVQSVGHDVGGGQSLSVIRRTTWRKEDDMAAAKMGDCEDHSDLVHDIKSGTRSSFNNKVRAEGHLVGIHILQAAYYDADLAVRDAVRAVITRRALRGKNPYSVEDPVSLCERRLQQAIVSPAERAVGEALRITVLGPSRHKQWRENVPAMYDKPMGGAYHLRSGLLFYVDVGRRELRVLKVGYCMPPLNHSFMQAPITYSPLVVAAGTPRAITRRSFHVPVTG